MLCFALNIRYHWCLYACLVIHWCSDSVCVCKCVCVCLLPGCMSRGQRPILNVFFSHFSSSLVEIFLLQFWLYWMVTESLTSVCLWLLGLRLQMCTTMPAFSWVLAIQTQVLMLARQSFTHWAIPPSPTTKVQKSKRYGGFQLYFKVWSYELDKSLV